MEIQLQPYREQTRVWPVTGRHILAQHDDERVVVYQAYRPEIGDHAAAHGVFGGAFSFDRMSWIKPNFLWMMFRSGWGTKEGQEVVLAITLRRAFFEEVLAAAVHSSYVEAVYGSHGAWKARLAASEVRLQWDPDHAPGGAKVDRRAIQLGLRGRMLRRYATEDVLAIDDVSELVTRGRAQLSDLDTLLTPRERVFVPKSADVRAALGLDSA